jgi:hypothetical protein
MDVLEVKISLLNSDVVDLMSWCTELIPTTNTTPVTRCLDPRVHAEQGAMKGYWILRLHMIWTHSPDSGHMMCRRLVAGHGHVVCKSTTCARINGHRPPAMRRQEGEEVIWSIDGVLTGNSQGINSQPAGRCTNQQLSLAAGVYLDLPSYIWLSKKSSEKHIHK